VIVIVDDDHHGPWQERKGKKESPTFLVSSKEKRLWELSTQYLIMASSGYFAKGITEGGERKVDRKEERTREGQMDVLTIPSE
jgi:hypothetical protein